MKQRAIGIGDFDKDYSKKLTVKIESAKTLIIAGLGEESNE